MSNPAEECSKKAKDIQDVFGEIDKWSAKNNAGCKEAFSFGLRKLKYQVQGTKPFKLKALTPALVGLSIAYARGWSLWGYSGKIYPILFFFQHFELRMTSKDTFIFELNLSVIILNSH